MDYPVKLYRLFNSEIEEITIDGFCQLKGQYFGRNSHNGKFRIFELTGYMLSPSDVIDAAIANLEDRIVESHALISRYQCDITMLRGKHTL